MRLDEDLNISIRISILRDTYDFSYIVEVDFNNEGCEDEKLEDELFYLNTEIQDCKTTQAVFYKLSELFKKIGDSCKGSERE